MDQPWPPQPPSDPAGRPAHPAPGSWSQPGPWPPSPPGGAGWSPHGGLPPAQGGGTGWSPYGSRQPSPGDPAASPDGGQPTPDGGQPTPDGGQPTPDGGQPNPLWQEPGQGGAHAPWPPAGYLVKPAPHPLVQGWSHNVWWRRVGAFWIDWLIGVVIFVVGVAITAINAGASSAGDPAQPALVTAGVAVMLAAIGVGFYNHGLLQGRTGWSWGKRALGLVLLSLETGQPVGVGPALLRTLVRGGLMLVGYVSVPIHLLSWLWPLWDDKRQTWEDKAINSVVVPADHAMIPPRWPG